MRKGVAVQVREAFGLNERQGLFVKAIISGVKPELAALQSGYTNQMSAYAILHSPNIRAAIHDEIQRMLAVDAPMSLKVLKTIRDDEKAPAKVRADVSFKLLTLAGHVAPRKNAADDKPLAEMTLAELRDFTEKHRDEIDRLEAEIAGRAQEVESQVSDATSPNDLSFLD